MLRHWVCAGLCPGEAALHYVTGELRKGEKFGENGRNDIVWMGPDLIMEPYGNFFGEQSRLKSF